MFDSTVKIVIFFLLMMHKMCENVENNILKVLETLLNRNMANIT